MSPLRLERKRKRQLLLGLGWLGLLGLALFLGLRWGPEMWALLQDEARLREAVRAFGLWGPMVFIGVQFLQVVIFVIPGDIVQITGGYIFGPGPGLLYSLIGIALGSSAAFFLGRTLGRPAVEALIRQERVKRLDQAISRGRGLAVLFLLFLLPGVPKDILCYISGLSLIPFPRFFLISISGRLPGLTLSTVFGSKLATREWGAVLAIAAVVIILLILSRFLRALEGWPLRRSGRGGP